MVHKRFVIVHLKSWNFPDKYLVVDSKKKGVYAQIVSLEDKRKAVELVGNLNAMKGLRRR